MEEIITTVNQKKERDQEKSLYGTEGGKGKFVKTMPPHITVSKR